VAAWLGRFAEAFAEKIHLDIRTKFWGYAKDEKLEATDLHKASQGG
jgi:5-methyltetrahydrofolate--homocysteine methyltransferase